MPDSISATARIGATDYPVEVEDLIADRTAHESLSCAAAAGCAILASSRTDAALLFSIPQGAASDAIRLPHPSRPLTATTSHHHIPHPPALAIWPAVIDGQEVSRIGVALLSRHAVLRVYPSVAIRDRASAEIPATLEIRLAATLASSLAPNHPPVPALAVLPLLPTRPALFVFGAHGTAALVDLSGGSLSARPVPRANLPTPTQRSSLRLGSLFTSAFRSFGALGPRGDAADAADGIGDHSIVTASRVGDGAVVVRRGGVIERWALDGLCWTTNIFNDPLVARAAILSAGTTSEGTLTLLVERASAHDAPTEKALLALDVRSPNAPCTELMLDYPLNNQAADDDPNCCIAVSGDIVYLYTPSTGELAWRSVARGVPQEGQVQGNHLVAPVLDVIGFVDATRDIVKRSPSGDGIAACLHADGIMLTSFDVPPTVSRDVDSPEQRNITVADSVAVLRRSFLQYEAGQSGAARAALAGLVQDLCANAFDINEAFNVIVEAVSHDIVSCALDPSKDLVTLLINSELEKRRAQHRSFVKMLADTELFTQIRPDAPSLAEDRIWDTIDVLVRYTVLTHSEKLATAIGIRNLENLESKRFHTGGFNAAASLATGGNKLLLEATRALRNREFGEEESKELEGLNLVSMALREAGRAATRLDVVNDKENHALTLYRDPAKFHKFLPALEQCMSRVLSRLNSQRNSSPLSSSEEAGQYTQASQSVVSTICETVVVVVQQSNEAREESSEKVASSFCGTQGLGNWLHDSTTCYEVLTKIAQHAFSVGAECPQAERMSVMELATTVVDNMLSCARLESLSYRTPKARNNVPTNSFKRRRIDLDYETTEWGRLLRSSMDMLRQNGLDDHAFRLAEKYADFGTMMALRLHSVYFDKFMENQLETFGEDFGLYAFRWLEERGHLELLLRGRPLNQDDGLQYESFERSDRMQSVLSKYFAELRPSISNLSWIHYVRAGDWQSAYDGIRTQINGVNVPGKEKSLPNTLFLSSVAKMMNVAVEDDDMLASHLSADKKQVEAIHRLAEIQDSVDPSHNAVAKGTEIIRRIVEEGSAESFELAKNVSLALRVVQHCETLGNESKEHEDYVWRRCVERQLEMWVSMAKTVQVRTDLEVKNQLMGTALFQAAKEHGINSTAFDEALDRGLLRDGELGKTSCESAVVKLLRTTVNLVASA